MGGRLPGVPEGPRGHWWCPGGALPSPWLPSPTRRFQGRCCFPFQTHVFEFKKRVHIQKTEYTVAQGAVATVNERLESRTAETGHPEGWGVWCG